MLKAHNVLIISAKDFGISIAVSMELQAFSSVYLLFVFFFFPSAGSRQSNVHI